MEVEFPIPSLPNGGNDMSQASAHKPARSSLFNVDWTHKKTHGKHTGSLGLSVCLLVLVLVETTNPLLPTFYSYQRDCVPNDNENQRRIGLFEPEGIINKSQLLK